MILILYLFSKKKMKKYYNLEEENQIISNLSEKNISIVNKYHY